jgi:hypothetical protein
VDLVGERGGLVMVEAQDEMQREVIDQVDKV